MRRLVFCECLLKQRPGEKVGSDVAPSLIHAPPAKQVEIAFNHFKNRSPRKYSEQRFEVVRYKLTRASTIVFVVGLVLDFKAWDSET